MQARTRATPPLGPTTPWPDSTPLRWLAARVRAAFRAESVDRRLLWLLASEGFGAQRRLQGKPAGLLDRGAAAGLEAAQRVMGMPTATARPVPRRASPLGGSGRRVRSGGPVGASKGHR